MKTLKKIPAIISTAAAITLSALPVSEFYDNPIDLCDFQYLVWHDCCGTEKVHILENGMAFADYKNEEYFVLTPAENVKLSRELLGIPDKYEFTIDENTAQARLPKSGIIKDELHELKVYIRKGLRKGIISKAEIETTITGKCVEDIRLAIKLKDDADIDEFIADYPKYELTTDNTDVPEEFKDHQLFTRTAEMDEMLDISEKGFKYNIGIDMAYKNRNGTGKNNSRVKSYEYFGRTCDEIHSITSYETFFDEYYYVDDPENIAWEESVDRNWRTYRTVVYKNGRIYPDIRKKMWISFITTDDYRNTSDFTDLPEKYSTDNPEWYDNELSLKRVIYLKNQEEIDEVAALAKGWAKKGIITEPVINRVYEYADGGFITLFIELEDPNDYKSFIADHPDYSVYNENNTGNPVFLLNEEQNTKLPEILEMFRSDSRVKSVKKSISYHSMDDSLYDDPEPIEYDEPEISPDNKTDTYIRGDISGNNKLDLYDAIEIAKYIAGTRKFTDEEMKIADINGDGKVNIYDAIAIAKKLISI